MKWQVDLSQLPKSTRTRLHELHQSARAVKMAEARIRQAKIAAYYRNHRPRAIEGIGGEEIALDPYWWQYYLNEHRIAPGEDKELATWLKRRRAEWCKVRHAGTRLQVGHGSTPTLSTPPAEEQRGVLYRKTY